jgi:formylglycine-generating enzyme required for sulfatase activity
MNAENPTQLKAKRLLRVNRGGSWLNLSARYARASNRDRYDPSNRNYHLGFRLVRNK